MIHNASNAHSPNVKHAWANGEIEPEGSGAKMSRMRNPYQTSVSCRLDTILHRSGALDQ